MIRCQVSNNPPPPVGPPIMVNGYTSQQLSRSKSLNDISNDSQIAVFASDRFINLHKNGNHMEQQQHPSSTQDHDVSSTIITATPMALTTFMPDINSYMYNQQQQQQQNSNNAYTIQQSDHINGIINNSNVFDTTNNNINNPLYNDNLRNLNTIPCSRQQQPQAPVSPSQLQTAANANAFNLCSPLAAMNLNGVTEQIGNLHL